jgi:hypothetical protein
MSVLLGPNYCQITGCLLSWWVHVYRKVKSRSAQVQPTGHRSAIFGEREGGTCEWDFLDESRV